MKKYINGLLIILGTIFFITYEVDYVFALGDIDSQLDIGELKTLAATAQATAKEPTDEYFKQIVDTSWTNTCSGPMVMAG